MAKKRAPSPPPPAESSEEEESGSSSAEEEEQEEEHPTKSENPNPNEEEIDVAEEEAEAEEEEEEEEEEEVEEEEEEEVEEEEEEEVEEEESAEEKDDSKTNPTAAAAPSTDPATAAAPKSGSDSESESGSDSPMVVKPISSKPMPEPGVKKSDKSSSGLFQRVWSLDDEIALLNGVLDFKNQTGSVPPSAGRKLGTEFSSFIKKYLHMDASEFQVSEKIGRLRKKYDNAASRSSLQFATPHDRTTFEISAKIWGEDTAAAAVAAANGKESPSNGNGYPFLKEAFAAKGWDFAAVMALENLDPGKAKALEEKFKKQKMAVMKHHLQRMELQKETVKLVMDGMDKTI
ncbi:heme-binding-like protein, chloroplastic [Iris pallida]|uniref:Heme-binding-like protein, chloroplastic n=1 Tax=Iris pallida TaxID=29817 RepID=A0AAX6FJ61_IRIPA|nr:heme-binding-like protein, chloroplastic [Iris pallida]